MRVIVPFGNANRMVEAFVVQLGEAEDTEPLKEIQSVLDEEPVLDESLIHLAAWMCSSMFCTFFDCTKVMLPTGLWFRHKDWYTRTDKATEEELERRVQQYPFLSIFCGNTKKHSGKEIAALCDGVRPSKALNELCKQGILTCKAAFSRKINDKTIMMYGLNMPEDEAAHRAEKWGRSPARLEVVSCLAGGEAYSKQDLMYQSGASANLLSTMVKQGILRSWEEEAFRMPELSDIEPRELKPLTQQQALAYERMRPLLSSGHPEAALLFGVTGSGKTQVYLHLIQQALEEDKGIIVLVPEIGLTPQMVCQFVSCFGDCVAVLHSALSVGERYDSWKRIANGTARVVIGTRSAVFAPVQNLGLLIIDEEQDDAYKAEHSPRYHARDIAKYRVMQNKALLVLGSATPAVESFYGAETGRYPLITLRERYAGTKLPQVTIADMRSAARQGYFGSIGFQLHQALEQTLQKRQQAILFLNRRGAARQVMCTGCGWTPECPSCSVSMTYHSVNGRIMCHFCGKSRFMPRVCPVCGSTHLKTEGVGTQRVEQELHQLFPSARVLRMDADTTSAKNAHEKLLSRFGAGEADILLGTQMVTKGLDFDNVSLVGVIDADQSLFAPDYRARERTFSLLTQVIGRAGRRGMQGHAVIQTCAPEHEVILHAARQDYEEFYQQEIVLRQALQCPPAAQILTLSAASETERDVLAALVAVKQRIEGLMRDQFSDFRYPVLGPAPARVLRVMNRYRYHLTIRCPEGKRRRELIGGILREFSADSRFHSVTLFADVNPTEL